MRCVLEARGHAHNAFITLTYDDDHLPANQSLDRTHLSKFLDRLRKKRGPFRYYACGEYGDNTKRAHYHACIFGLDFPDKVEFRRIGDCKLYISHELNKLWGYGNTSVGALTFESAAYCARYVLKKKLSVGKKRQDHFVLQTDTGELVPVAQPFAAMSLGRGPGNAIGGLWWKQFHGDIYNGDKDFLVLRGKKLKPPKYFDKLYDLIDPVAMERVKKKREEEREELSIAELRAHERNTRARLISRKQV